MSKFGVHQISVISGRKWQTIERPGAVATPNSRLLLVEKSIKIILLSLLFCEIAQYL